MVTVLRHISAQGLPGRALRLIGAGGIAQELFKLARPFFARMIVADPHAEAGPFASSAPRSCRSMR